MEWEWTNAAVPVGAVIVGWLLGEAGQLLRGRRSRREATGKALVEFLSLWHDLRLIQFIQRSIELLDVNKQEECQVLRHIASTRCGYEGFGTRLESVVASLAAH